MKRCSTPSALRHGRARRTKEIRSQWLRGPWRELYKRREQLDPYVYLDGMKAIERGMMAALRLRGLA